MASRLPFGAGDRAFTAAVDPCDVQRAVAQIGNPGPVGGRSRIGSVQRRERSVESATGDDESRAAADLNEQVRRARDIASELGTRRIDVELLARGGHGEHMPAAWDLPFE